MLWQCVKEHLPAFLARAVDTERALPVHVHKELWGFLACGDIELGFARVACGGCGFTRLVPWSCKGRGVCPSCVARRMRDTAAHLCDHVFPKVPVRQWVLPLPPPLRYVLAWDTELCARVTGIFMRAVHRHLGRVAKREAQVARLGDAAFGGVCMVQRWGGSANLNIHLHALVADGVFVTDASSPRFVALPAPEKSEVAVVAWEVCEKIVALLRKRGQWLDADPADDPFAQREPLLAELYAASIAGTLVLGPKAGQRQVRLFGAAARSAEEYAGKVRNAYGFDVHAGTRVTASDRSGLERLARYMTRPPLSKQRLVRLADGRYRIALKTPWRDGTTHIVLHGVELVGRLAALVPPPRFHLTRYYGVFAPRAKLRRDIVPGHGDDCCAAVAARPEADSPMTKRRRLAWSKLLARLFAIDVLVCPRCAAAMQKVEVCTTLARIREVLQGATGPPQVVTARA